MNTRRRPAAVLAALACVLLLTGFTMPGAVQRLWRKADRAVKAKDYAGAVGLYEQAQKLQPREWALRYNAATAAAMGKDYNRALPGLETVAREGDDQLREPAEFNAGNALLEQGKAAEAIEHYKRALYLRPDDINAKWNLELAKRKQQQQKQQQKQDKQGQKKQQDRKQQPNQPPKQNPKDQQGKQGQQPRQMSQEEARRLLQSLSQQDRDLQKQMRRARPTRESHPDKDW